MFRSNFRCTNRHQEDILIQKINLHHNCMLLHLYLSMLFHFYNIVIYTLRLIHSQIQLSRIFKNHYYLKSKDLMQDL